MILRDYQVEVKKKVIDLFHNKRKSVCVVMPPGGGKTVTGSHAAIEIARLSNGPVLWVAHRKELIKQAQKTINALGFQAGIIAPWAKRQPENLIQIASIQTLRALGIIPQCSVAVWDEAHHSMGDDWNQLAKQLEQMKAFLIGLTATPERSDGRGLRHVFSTMVVAATQKSLIMKGQLVPTEVFVPEVPIVNSIADAPVKMWEKHAKGTKTLVFCENIDHAQVVTAEFIQRGYKAAYIEGNMTSRQRDSVIKRFENNKIDILCNCQILTEGFDLPPIQTTILARSVGSVSLYLQMVGRGSRPFPNKKKSLCLDLAGNAYLWGLPDDDRKFSLIGKPICLKKEAEHKNNMARCPNCGNMVLKKKPCSFCGSNLVKIKTKLAGKKLKRFDSEEGKHIKQSAYNRWLDYAKNHNKSIDWVNERFYKKFGHLKNEAAL